MKILKPLIISLFAYLFISIIIIVSLNYYVNIKYDKDAKLWEKYQRGREEYRKKTQGDKTGIWELILSQQDEGKYRKIFEREYGKDIYWYQYISDNYPNRVATRNTIMSVYKYAVTPLWLFITILILVIESGWFTNYRIKATIISVTILWVIITVYLSALFRNEMQLTNTLVLIVVPITIAVGLIYLVDIKNK